jgi:putative heme-binding domain-containing protein
MAMGSVTRPCERQDNRVRSQGGNKALWILWVAGLDTPQEWRPGDNRVCWCGDPPASRTYTMRPIVRGLTVMMLAATLAPSRAAAPVQGLALPPGFEVTEFAGDDLAHDIHTMTLDPQGRVVVAGRGYIRMLVDDDGDGRADRAITVADTPRDGAMGMLWEGNTLWCVGDGGLRRFTIGPDGKALGPSELVRKLKTGGEHDAHALRRGSDGWLYLLCGNTTGIGAKDAQRPTSPVREPIAGGVLRFPPDLSDSEVVADGFRNAYDFDFNDDGELFTFDSDNERCVGLPWYEGTRFYHVIPGGHYGWRAPQRAETWRMPPYFYDVVRPIADLGRGSPTGVACYRHRQFPTKYRGGFFLADWTFGRLWFVPLRRAADTYAGTPELFLEATGDHGFAPTALCVHPRTGDLYVSIGGRGTRGAVYRIRYPAGMADAANFVTPALPKRELPRRVPPALVTRTEGKVAGEVWFDLARNSVVTIGAQRASVRRAQLFIGDIGAPSAKGTVWEGYTVREPRAGDHRDLRSALRERFPHPEHSADIDREVSRTLAMLADDDPGVLQRVAAKWTSESHPVEDIHYLIVAARLTAERTPPITKAVAGALLGLDRKFTERRLNRDSNWPLRIAELHAELARRDPGLNRVLVAADDFPRPGNVLFTRCPGFDRRRAAEQFHESAKTRNDFPWNVELVRLMGNLSGDQYRPILRSLWLQGGYENAIVAVLSRDPQSEDRDKFVAGLRSPQLTQITDCLDALDKMREEKEPAELLALVRVLRSLGDGKAEVPVRDHVVRRLQRVTGQMFGPDRPAWTAWLAAAHPELAAQLGGADGVDVDAWHKRLAATDWARGDAERGKGTFQRASCASCHSGSTAVGPDLRGVASRFSRDDLLTAILQPSKDISPRYRTTHITTTDGKVYQGLIIYEAVDGLILQTGSAETVRIAGGQIESRGFTDTSLMPAGLLDKLSDHEIADLLAYLKALK